MTWLYLGERDKVVAQQSQVANYQHAEQIALDYAVNAATMNFRDLNTWKAKLVNGTTPSLNDKLTKAATSMEQILVPLEWNSTAQPLVAKVRSDTNGIYVIDTFVSVLTKTTQAPDNLQSTATYSITIDGNDNWQISDVGGIGAVAGAK
jgi:Mce-associated membrane protein